jgi:CBS-domain-containing membrane protein
MLIKDLMTKTVITVKPEQTVQEVAEMLHQYHFTGIPVADNRNRLLGVISERDFIASDSKLYLPTYIKLLQDTDFISGDKKLLPQEARDIIEATAEDIMNRSVVTAKAEMTLEELADLFATKRVNPIPVTDTDGNIVGIVSRSDLIKLFSKKNIDQVVQNENVHRPIDSRVDNVYDSVQSRFAFVAKFRANVWITVAVVLFVIGFIAGIVYVADPHIFTGDTELDQYQQ